MKTILLILALFLSSCYGTYYISDAEYSDLREDHASVTYHNGSIYWGWHSGYYYYYGKPHYYPWYYYYNTCPPSTYNTVTHVIIVNPVNRPSWRPNRPNRPNWNSNRPNRPNRPNWNSNKPNNNNKVIINKNKNNKVNVNKNRNNKVNVKKKRK